RRYSLDSPGKWTFGSRSTSRHLFMSRGLPLRAIVSILSYAPNSLPCGVGNSERLLGIGNLHNLFFWSELYRQPGEVSIVFLLMKIPMLLRLAWAAVVVGGARSVPDRAARSNSERAAPLACVGKRFSALRLGDVWAGSDILALHHRDTLPPPCEGLGQQFRASAATKNEEVVSFRL